MTDSRCASAGVQYLFELVYFFYVCSTMIVLLNTLIAMLNHRYEKSRPKAENIWRFRILSVMSALERHDTLKMVMNKCGILNFSGDGEEGEGEGNNCTCTGGRSRTNEDDIVNVYEYNDKHSGSLFFNRKLKRYYLQLVLPVDEQLRKL